MEILKLKSENVGTHYPVQAVIFTEKKELFITKDEPTAEGFELLKFQTYDLEAITTIINNLLRGVTVARKAIASLENAAISVSPVANLYAVDSTLSMGTLNNIVGGYESQVITLISNISSLDITNQGNIQIDQTFTITNPYSIVMLQKFQEGWLVLSNNINH